ncbi:hypothetical protein TNCT_174821 [Trichonephila clavata]|uniref:Uncharacterized protein n=1 Tax=Trichonephila clavata TaxID=2740835 RepID=A0A8X6K6Y3_TRICU|nr:hypothetical protein TNCT_174821 [Trichonephila clavata]
MSTILRSTSVHKSLLKRNLRMPKHEITEMELEWLVKMFRGSEKKEFVREGKVNEDDVEAELRSLVAQLELVRRVYPS